MLALSQTSAYAVHALSWLHHHGSESSMIRDIASSTGIPKPYLAKVLNNLNHSGLVTAKRGYRGGVMLARPARQISILDVVEAAEGKDWIAECPLGNKACRAKGACPIHGAWGKISAEVRSFLGSTNLADTIPFNTKRVLPLSKRRRGNYCAKSASRRSVRP